MKKTVFAVLALLLILVMPATALAAPTASPRDWTEKAPDGNLLDDAVSAQAAILMDARTGDILYQKNAYAIMRPASLTKVMTCLIALENCELTDQLSITGLTDLPGDASKAGFKKGQIVSVEDALYGLMLPSGADAAVSLAIHIAGSVEGFCTMMNDRASQLGMTNTHYKNPHGLDEADHVSTAYDQALLVYASMKMPKFRTIVSTTQYTTQSSGVNLTMSNTNKLVSKSDSEVYAYTYALGVKTGYTGLAQHCLASAASKGDMELVGIVLKDSKNGKWVSSITMFEYGFAFWDSINLQQAFAEETIPIEVPNALLSDSETGMLEAQVVTSDAVWMTDKKDVIDQLRQNLDQFERRVTVAPGLTAPIARGDTVGAVTYLYEGQEVFTSELIASRNVKAIDTSLETPLITTPGQTLAPGATPLPDPYGSMIWIKYVLIGLLVVVVVPVAALLIIQLIRQRQYRHYTYRPRRRK